MKARAAVKLLERTRLRATARATVELDGQAETASYTLDASDGSELAVRLTAQGPIGLHRLERLRARVPEYAREKALHIAFHTLCNKRLTPALRAEEDARLPEQAKSPELAAKCAEHAILWAAVEEAKRVS